MDTAERESRDYPRLKKNLMVLDDGIKDLYTHARALHNFVGTDYKLGPDKPADSEVEPAPMIWLFDKVLQMRARVETLDKMLRNPLRELHPAFYEADLEERAKGDIQPG